MTSRRLSSVVLGHAPFGQRSVFTCGSVGSFNVYEFTVIPEEAPPALLPLRKFVSRISASSFVVGFSGVVNPQFLQMWFTIPSSGALKYM